MYEDEEQIMRHKTTYLSKKCYELLKAEKKKLRLNGRNISLVKILNNLILEKYDV